MKASADLDLVLDDVLRSVPSAVSSIRTSTAPGQEFLSRTMRSISLCEVTPTCFRNLRSEMLNLSSGVLSVIATS